MDEAAAYDWATKQTGWDPYQAKAMLDQQTSVFGHALREGEPDAPAQDEPEAESEVEPSDPLNDDSKDEAAESP